MGNQSPAPRIAYIVTEAIFARKQLQGQLRGMQARGFDVTLISGPSKDLHLASAEEGINVVGVAMRREVALWSDLVALARLVKCLRRLRPVAVVTSTPKAGLLGTVAAFLARVPRRIYRMDALRLETTSGLKRAVLTCTERVACAAATRVLCGSGSLLRTVLELRLTDRNKAIISLNGSANGIDLDKFSPAGVSPGAVAGFAARVGLPAGPPVVTFVGRLTRDKGIADLYAAFQTLRRQAPTAVLLLVGPFEAGDPVDPHIRQALTTDSNVRLAGFCEDVRPALALSTVLALPSYREGFGGVCLEAAGFRLPTVGYRVTGLVDAVVDGQTGVLVTAGDTAALANAIFAYITDERLRAKHGAEAWRRAERDFNHENVWDFVAGQIDPAFKPAAQREEQPTISASA